MSSSFDTSLLSQRLSSSGIPPILVIGDVMLDEYHWCTVHRISPEAPVPVCRVDYTTLVPGGAANVAHNLQTLGAQVHLLGIIGQDSTGDKLRSALVDFELSTKGLIQDTQKPTTLKSRVVAHQQHIVRVDRENSHPISEDLETILLNQFEAHLPGCGVVILSDYNKGTLTPRIIEHVIESSKKQDVLVLVDPKGDDFSKYEGASILTPNFHEFQAVSDRKLHSEESISEEGLALMKRLSLDALVITRSERGASVITNQHKTDILAHAIEVFDITGAGDTFIAVLALGLALEETVENAAYLANVAAGIVVGKIGTSTVSREELLNALSKL
jgi:D-beta-D-heptose 7-phosphate kinase/D-beta-D-heptose 1-phosphate adenosyltransferase